MVETTPEEKKAISSLSRLAKRWPKSLWLFSADGSLMVMKYRKDGSRAISADGITIDSEFVVDEIQGIDNDGGDW